jgi:hypothetical protein
VEVGQVAVALTEASLAMPTKKGAPALPAHPSGLYALTLENMEVGQVAVALIQVEAVADEQLVRDREADITHGQVLDEPPVRPVEQRHRGEGAGGAEGERLAEVVERQAGVDDVLDDDDVAAGDLRVEILEQPDAGVAALVGAGCVARELEEVEPVRNAERAREVGEEDEARLQRRDEQRLAAVVVTGELAAELAYARRQLLAGEVDVAEARAAAYDASSSRYRSARRSMSRL